MLSHAFDLDSADLAWGLILAIVLVLVVGAVAVVRKVGKVRDRVMPALRDAAGAFRSLLETPRRAFDLLGSNILARLVLAMVLALILVGMGSPIPLTTALAVVVLTSLLAGLAPVPGGVGAAEAVLTAGLVAVGVGENTAFAAAVIYRVVTFYLPSAAGWFAVRWEEHRGYL